MKKISVFLLILLLAVAIVYAPNGGTGEEETLGDDYNWDSDSLDIPDIANHIENGNVPEDRYDEVDWSNVPDQGVVPADRISFIPKDKVKVNQVKDPSKLTYEQLNYGNNFDEIWDKSKLDPMVLSRILRDRTMQNTQADLGDGPVDGELGPDGFWLSHVDALQIGDMSIVNGEGITYYQGRIHIDKADSVVFGGSYATDVNNITLDADVIEIESADMVVAKCVIADNVRTTTFAIDGGVNIYPYEDVSYPVEVSGTEMEFISPDYGSMNVECLTPPEITLNDAVVNITTGNVIERIEANNSVEFTTGAYGVEFMNLHPLASYYYTDKNHIEKDFSIKVNLYEYQLGIRKHISQQVNDVSCDQCGIIDLATNRIKLNGMIDYKRYLFKIAGNNYVLLGLLQRNVFVPENNNSVFFEYDRENRFLPVEKIMKDAPPIASYISNYLVLHELGTGEATHTFAEINVNLDQTQISQNLISSYETSYDTSKAEITNNAFEEDNILILPPGHGMIRELT